MDLVTKDRADVQSVESIAASEAHREMNIKSNYGQRLLPGSAFEERLAVPKWHGSFVDTLGFLRRFWGHRRVVSEGPLPFDSESLDKLMSDCLEPGAPKPILCLTMSSDDW